MKGPNPPMVTCETPAMQHNHDGHTAKPATCSYCRQIEDEWWAAWSAI